jgi:hypothetical protein
LVQTLPLQRSLLEVMVNPSPKKPEQSDGFLEGLAKHYTDPELEGWEKKVHDELAQVLGFDLAGDFKGIAIDNLSGKRSLTLGYKLTTVSTSTNTADVAEILSTNMRPALVLIRDRINDTIDRIPLATNTRA